MYFDIRTDLACEMMDQRDSEATTEKEVCESHRGGRITRVRIKDDAAARAYNKPCGEYLTIDCGKLHLLPSSVKREAALLLASELSAMSERLAGKPIDASFGVLVVGLGNASLTADAIGPATVARLTATRHLKAHDAGLFQSLECSALCAIAPGVLGQTGIETQEVVRGIVRSVRPDLLIAVDSLAARSCERLSCTVQLSDSGISPGSGVGNHRSELSKKTLGVPVIALGVPTVVHSATLVYDALQAAGLEVLDQALQRALNEGINFYVSPKESDLVTEAFAELLATAIGLVFTGGI